MANVLHLSLWMIIFGSWLAECQWRRSFWNHNKWRKSLPVSEEKPYQSLNQRFQKTNKPIKGIEFKKCECPPHNECKMNFKLNEAALEINKYRTIISKEDIQKLKEAHVKKPVHSLRRIRRFNEEVPDVDCCCPPRSVLMPTIITEKKFNETLNRMAEGGHQLD